MIRLFLYVFLYCNSDTILNKLYLSEYTTITNNESIQSNANFYYSIINLQLFSLSVYLIYIIKVLAKYNKINNTSIALAFVYVKYTLNILLNSNMTLSQYEFSKNIMWLFATPLMLKMYCDVNNLHLRDINIHCHLIPIAINILICPHKKTQIYYYFTGVSWILLLFFIKTLVSKRDLLFTNVYLFIWTVFMCLNIIDIFQFTDQYSVNLYY
jgi:hypothetical protein